MSYLTILTVIQCPKFTKECVKIVSKSCPNLRSLTVIGFDDNDNGNVIKEALTMQDAEINVIDRTNNNIKLLTLEALHISRRAPSINQKEEYRTRELTLRV